MRGGLCARHQAERDAELGKRKAEIDSRRASPSRRGYDRAWRKLRAAFLAAHPLCQCDDCGAGEKRVTAAEVVDHIEPISTHPELRLAWGNLRAMAKRCHDRHTARTQGFARRRRTPARPGEGG